MAGNCRIHDDHHRRRNQNSERAAGGNHAGRELDVVAGAQHRVEGDHTHQHHDRADQAAGDAPERAHDQRCDRERGGHASERELDRIEHLVDQRAALHHVAHQHEQRDRDQHVVGHGAVGALDHQVEHPVVPPSFRRVVESDEAEEDAEPHQREGGCEAHHDHDHDERQHQKPEGGIAHVLSLRAHAALARGLVDLVRALDRDLARLVVDVFAVRQLLLDHVDLGDVMQPRRPRAGAQAHHAAHNLGYALQHHQPTGDRDHRLEMIDRRSVGGDVGMFGDPPGIRRVVVAGVDQRGDPRDKKHDIKGEIEPGLHPRPHRAVEKITAHMRVLCQRVGAAQHEQRAVKHVVGVEDPGRRRVQDVALEHLDADQRHQADDQPRRRLADPGADGVDRK